MDSDSHLAKLEGRVALIEKELAELKDGVDSLRSLLESHFPRMFQKNNNETIPPVIASTNTSIAPPSSSPVIATTIQENGTIEVASVVNETDLGTIATNPSTIQTNLSSSSLPVAPLANPKTPPPLPLDPAANLDAASGKASATPPRRPQVNPNIVSRYLPPKGKRILVRPTLQINPSTTSLPLAPLATPKTPPPPAPIQVASETDLGTIATNPSTIQTNPSTSSLPLAPLATPKTTPPPAPISYTPIISNSTDSETDKKAKRLKRFGPTDKTK